MSISVFDLYSIGIGPSSSHTVGPMRAARRFVDFLEEENYLERTASIRVELFGSLALTGHGHGTDKAILLGLEGHLPESIDPNEIEQILNRIRTQNEIKIKQIKPLPFIEDEQLLFLKDKVLPFHSNGMRFRAVDTSGEWGVTQVYYSIGGGFIVDHEAASHDNLTEEPHVLPYPFKSCAQLLKHCDREKLSIAEVMMANELSWRSKEEVRRGLLDIWQAMKQSVERGCKEEGILPGGLNVKRRAPELFRRLSSDKEGFERDPAKVMDWVSLWALAVNEENAAGGRVVTAPTNGAAGIIPAVLHYYEKFDPSFSEDGACTFLLVAGAVGILYKEGASISAAEVGCQGEVGVACSMAAAGLAAVGKGTNEQIENAAEIGMEHNLGLTCDPVAGLVQIPCIERNTMGSIKAINAARLGLQGDGSHQISLDKVIATMRQTGLDMQTRYKETSQGGLAVNVTEC